MMLSVSFFLLLPLSLFAMRHVPESSCPIPKDQIEACPDAELRQTMNAMCESRSWTAASWKELLDIPSVLSYFLTKRETKQIADDVLNDPRFRLFVVFSQASQQRMGQILKLLLHHPEMNEYNVLGALERATYNAADPGDMHSLCVAFLPLISYKFSAENAGKAETAIVEKLLPMEAEDRNQWIDAMRKNPTFPVANPDNSLNGNWWALLQHDADSNTDSLDLLLQIFIKWKAFRDRVKLSLSAPLMYLTHIYMNRQAYMILSSRSEVYESMRNKYLTGTYRGLEIGSLLPPAFLQGFGEGKETGESSYCSYMSRLQASDPDSELIRTLWVFSPCSDDYLEPDILAAISKPSAQSEAFLIDVLDAGKLRVDHLHLIFGSKISQATRDRIDAAFGPVDIASIQYSIHGRAVPYLLELSKHGDATNYLRATDLLARASSLTSFQFLEGVARIAAAYQEK